MGLQVVRNSDRRHQEIPQGSGRLGGGLQDRGGRSASGRQPSTGHQRTNPSSATAGNQLRNAGPALSRTRDARHLLQEPVGQAGGIRQVEGRKSYATQDTYEGYLKKWILPRWRSYRLGNLKTVQVEQWLHSLPLAQGSRAKIRNIMSALYSHAIRWEWITYNPITAVRQSTKRSKVPIVLTIEQIQALLPHLGEPCHTAVLLDVATGVRVGELLGLKWADIDFEKLEINVTRSVVKQRVGPCKTEASQK